MGGGEESQAGGLFTPAEAGTIDGKPPPATGAPGGPHNTDIRGDVFHHGKGEEGSLLGVNERGGGSHRGLSIS